MPGTGQGSLAGTTEVELAGIGPEPFAARTRGEWSSVFEGTDACVVPVLSLREAADHPHVAARGSVRERDGMLGPGTAPRFSAHPGWSATDAPQRGADTREVLEAAGIDATGLIASGAARQA